MKYQVAVSEPAERDADDIYAWLLQRSPQGARSLHAISQELDQLLDRLDSETATLLEQTVRDAVALAKKRTETGDLTDGKGYPIGYFEATAGSFEHEPLERPADLPLESREPW